MSGDDRPRFHLTPPAGWMNDPNGLIFHDGRLHAFYQYEPDMPRWGRMRWGHATSRDLISWTHLPVALEPGRTGPDSLGCWSGSVVDDGLGRAVACYTSVTRWGGLRRASISIAVSDDGLSTWRKDPDGPVIIDPPTGIRRDRFRDPFVWRDDAGWAMLVGAGTIRSQGTVLLYRSTDLRAWRYVGPFLTTHDAVTAAPDVRVEDIDSPCWECPQLVRFGGGDVLIMSIVDRSRRVRPAHVVACIGRMVGDRFVVRHIERLGLGPDFYAPAVVAAPDGRCLLFGWIPEDPPVRSSVRTWAGSFTLPRQLVMDPDGSLRLTFAAEVDGMPGVAHPTTSHAVREAEPWVCAVGAQAFALDLTVVTAGAASIRFDVAADGRVAAELRFDPWTRTLTVVRSGQVAVAGRDPHGSIVLPEGIERGVHLRLVVDGSVLELVVDERVTATARLPDVADGPRTVACTPIGGPCHLVDVRLTELGGATHP